jgi:hypothetical protein
MIESRRERFGSLSIHPSCLLPKTDILVSSYPPLNPEDLELDLIPRADYQPASSPLPPFDAPIHPPMPPPTSPL